MTRVLRVVGLALLLWPGALEATPVTYTFAYTAGTSTVIGAPSVPSFTFAVELPGYITTAGMFALPQPVVFETGVSLGIQSVTEVGTNHLGWWIFGTNGSAGISDGGGSIVGWAGCSYQRGPCFAFLPDPYADYLTAPGSRTGISWGQTLWFPTPGQVARLDGTFTLTVAEMAPGLRVLAPVSEGGSAAGLLLLGIGGVCWMTREGRR